jgi:hypothetical protein
MSENSRAVPHRSFASLATSDFLPAARTSILSRLDNPDEPLCHEAPVAVEKIGATQSSPKPPVRKFDATPLIAASVVAVLLGLFSAVILFGSYNPSVPGNATAKAVVVDGANNVNLLELDIRGKPYQCRATVDSLATPQIHCEPEGS